ncbi:MAG: YhcH/YjgK/YiaL family protein [Proteobacteria bacterium]|nr:YhcH/YjgK/YiaL family protein [Pseudomonadota bacterium]
MIYDILENTDRYAALHDGFGKAFAFLRRSDLLELAVDKYAIDGDRVFAMVARDQGRSKDEGLLEVHEKYIDIQMVLSGIDEMGWKPKSHCLKPTGPYDHDGDIRFYADPPAAWLPVELGMFAVFFPEDAHLPLISSGLIHKVVVKVAVGKG